MISMKLCFSQSLTISCKRLTKLKPRVKFWLRDSLCVRARPKLV